MLTREHTENREGGYYYKVRLGDPATWSCIKIKPFIKVCCSTTLVPMALEQELLMNSTKVQELNFGFKSSPFLVYIGVPLILTNFLFKTE